jgi:hypothetical protein
MKSEAHKQIIDEKKKLFLFWIDWAVQSYKISSSVFVKFWENHDLDHFVNARAHIHLENNTVCISQEELSKMTKEEIKETAIHEITHILERDHNPIFYENLTNEIIGSWTPDSSGIIMVSENSYRVDLVGDTIKEAHCSYHLCQKIHVKLKKCKYCNNLFCEGHIDPREPASKLSYKNSHPCLAYALKKEEANNSREIKFIKEKKTERVENLVLFSENKKIKRNRRVVKRFSVPRNESLIKKIFNLFK